MLKFTLIGCFNASNNVNLDVSRTNEGLPNLASKYLFKKQRLFSYSTGF